MKRKHDKRPRNQPDLVLRDMIIRLRDEGKTFQEIAKFFGSTRQNIHKLYHKAVNDKPQPDA